MKLKELITKILDKKEDDEVRDKAYAEAYEIVNGEKYVELVD